jgi:hypothetical protein
VRDAADHCISGLISLGPPAAAPWLLPNTPQAPTGLIATPHLGSWAPEALFLRTATFHLSGASPAPPRTRWCGADYLGPTVPETGTNPSHQALRLGGRWRILPGPNSSRSDLPLQLLQTRNVQWPMPDQWVGENSPPRDPRAPTTDDRRRST